MKTMCVVTCNHDDKDLITFLAHSNEYDIKYLIFPCDEILVRSIWNIPIYPVVKALYCIRECDVLYLSSNLDYQLKNELSTTAKQYNKIIYMPETVVTSRLDIQKVNLPIILVSSLGKDLNQLDFVFGLKKCLDDYVGRTIIFSDDCRLMMFSDIYNWAKGLKSRNSLSDTTKEINRFINEKIVESSASCCIIHCSSGIYNPLSPEAKENDYFISHVSDACKIDYSIFILPFNFSDDITKTSYQRIIKQKTDIAIDTMIIDNVFWDLSRKKGNIRPIRMHDDYDSTIVSGTIIEEKNTNLLCSLVFKDIVNKLSIPRTYRIY